MDPSGCGAPRLRRGGGGWVAPTIPLHLGEAAAASHAGGGAAWPRVRAAVAVGRGFADVLFFCEPPTPGRHPCGLLDSSSLGRTASQITPVALATPASCCAELLRSDNQGSRRGGLRCHLMLLLGWMGRLLPRRLRCRRHRCLCACRIHRGCFLTASLTPLIRKESDSTVWGTAEPPRRERPLRCNSDFPPLKSPLLPPMPQSHGGRGRGNAHVDNAADHSPSATIAGGIPPATSRRVSTEEEKLPGRREEHSLSASDCRRLAPL